MTEWSPAGRPTRSFRRVGRWVLPLLLVGVTACDGGGGDATTAEVSSATATAAPFSTAPAVTTTPETSTTSPTTTVPAPPAVWGEPWPDLPLVDVAMAQDGDVLIAGPVGVMLIRGGEPVGLLTDRAATVATADGIGGLVHALGNDLTWLPVTGGTEWLGRSGYTRGSFRLQEVDWVPRLGRYEDGAWMPTYNGLVAFAVEWEEGYAGVLVTTRNPLWQTEHWEISLPPRGEPTAVASTGRHRVWATRDWSRDGWRSRLEFYRIDGTLDSPAFNPLPEYRPGLILALDAEFGGSLVVYALASGSAVPFGGLTTLHVADLADGTDLLAQPIGRDDQEIVRLDLHDRGIAVSTRSQMPGGLTLDLVRLVDLDTGEITTLPWGGTASFFHIADPLPASTYPIAMTDVPELVVTSPIEGTVTTESAVRFEGYTTPGANVVAAGRFPVVVGDDGRWSTTLVLGPGGNLAEFTAALAGGGTAETALAVFRSTGSQFGYALNGRGERGDPDTLVLTAYVHDAATLERLQGVVVTLQALGTGAEPRTITLVTDVLGTVEYRTPITGGSGYPMGCLMSLEFAGYPTPPPRGGDQPEGSITCVFA